jgi:hypothetical protein
MNTIVTSKLFILLFRYISHISLKMIYIDSIFVVSAAIVNSVAAAHKRRYFEESFHFLTFVLIFR